VINITRIIRFFFYFSIIIILILYLFPGSLIGYFLYDDLRVQPSIISNPLGTSINHLICFFCLSLLGFLSYIEAPYFKKIFIFLFLMSGILEILHIIVPKRSFELLDLIANILGVLIIYILALIYKKKEKNI
jgi:VanZ family protein